MPAILTALFSLLSGLGGSLGNYFKSRLEIEKLKVETDRQIQLAQLTAAQAAAKEGAEVAKTVLSATSSNFKYFTFIMWFGPFIIGVIKPSLSQEIFHNLAGMPEWYVQSCMTIMFTVWGIQVSAPVVGSIFNGLGSFFQARRDYKLEKAKIDRKAYFEALRKIKGTLSQSEVDEDNKLLDELEGK